MLSILIPVYNYDASSLIRSLHRLCVDAAIEFEIRVLDDASIAPLKPKNQTVADLPHLYYRELQKNVGRAAIRNLLANEAQYRYLLFIDCDAEITSDAYIRNYLPALQPGVVAFGGVAYAAQKPDKNYRLRWYYGRKYEAVSASKRSEQPWKSFSFFNTVIDKTVFQQIQCNDVVRKYGHEDTLFGYMLENAQVKITHLENPLIHLGLNTNRAFLAKTKEGIECLIDRAKSDDNALLLQQSQLFSYKNKISKLKLVTLHTILYVVVGRLLEAHIIAHPSHCILLQLYKALFIGYKTKQESMSPPAIV